eukprot:gene1924-biopygen1803
MAHPIGTAPLSQQAVTCFEGQSASRAASLTPQGAKLPRQIAGRAASPTPQGAKLPRQIAGRAASHTSQGAKLPRQIAGRAASPTPQGAKLPRQIAGRAASHTSQGAKLPRQIAGRAASLTSQGAKLPRQIAGCAASPMPQALSYLHDVVGEYNATLDESEDGELSYDELQTRFHAVTNSVHGVYTILRNRWTMLELRGQLKQEPGSSQRGGADALRVKLQFVEDRVYQAADGVVAAELLQQWLNDFDDKNRGKAMLSATLKSAANADARVVKDHRAQRWKVERKTYDDEKDTKPAGKGGKGWGAKPTMRDRNEKKGQWESVQVVEHLGLEVNLKLGQFRVTERRVHKINVNAKEILCDAARRLAAFTGLCRLVYLTMPVARLYLRERYFVLAEKRSWGAKEFNEDGKAHVLYADGDEETLDLSEENFKIICTSVVSELTDVTADVNGEAGEQGRWHHRVKRCLCIPWTGVALLSELVLH